MKRASSMILCALLAAAFLALALMAPERELSAPEASPTALEQARVTPQATPTPEASLVPPDEPGPEASGAPEQGSDVVFTPPGTAGVVAGPEYDYAAPVPESEAVGEEYFADAVFIGDSRTDGFRMFSGLSQGDYIVKTGLSVFKLDTDKVKVGEEKLTVAQALGRKAYGKVYVCLGLNELGMYNDQGYYDHYAALLDTIAQLQPEAAVYVQLLIPVNEQKCAEKGVADYINNEQIEVYNGLLRQLAQEKRVFLTDPAQAIVEPDSGQPPYDAVADGVHFQKEPYRQWLEYLKRHTVRREEPTEQELTWTLAPEASQEEEPT